MIFAGTRQQLTQALARADGDDHLDEDTFNEGLDGLPESALARVYADVEALLKNDPGSADARKIKWVDALRTLGATVVAKDDGHRRGLPPAHRGRPQRRGPADRAGRRLAGRDQAQG